MNSKIGIGITTRDRNQVFAYSLSRLVEHLPKDCTLAIVDDNSKVPVAEADYRFETNVGVARAKNKCLELLKDCDHIFLFDDDTYPINDGWWQPYINHDEPHLMYQFKLPNKPESDMQLLYQDEDTTSWSHTRGAMIYLERRVLDAVGGFDTKYGLGGFEHPDFTNRVHNAGLTTHRAMDVVNSNELLYCLDQDGKVDSSVNLRDKTKNYKYYQSQRKSKEFKEYIL